MMTIREMQEAILRLKKERDVCILAHAYQGQEIHEIADYMGDSFGLAKTASRVPQQKILMCGVRFMAETIKILSPQKTVWLSNPDAGCPMADQMEYDYLVELKRRLPDHTTVCYINTTAAVKTLCDVCVTSSAALTILRNIENDKILFVPDPNLGGWLQRQLPEKHIQLFTGGCPAHYRITAEEAKETMRRHPTAQLLVHPECRREVVELADYVGSTTGIMQYAKTSPEKEFIIGTENSIVTHLQYDCPEKHFFPLSAHCICQNMRLTTLYDIYHLLQYGGEEITLSDHVLTGARRCIDEMLRLGEIEPER